MKKRRSSEVSETRILDLKGQTLGELALIYPNDYSLAVANLGFNRVFEIFSKRGFKVYRFVYKTAEGRLQSLDGPRRIEDIKLWLLSLHFELDLLNVAKIFSRMRLPLRPEWRTHRHPVTVVGGALTYFMSPTLLDIFDAVYVGELEPNVEELTRTIFNSSGHGRDRLMGSLAEVPGVLVKSKLYRDEGFLCKDEGATTFARSVFLSKNGAFGYRFLLEVERGCKRACRFCVVGHRMTPARYADLQWVLEELRKGLCFTDKIGLVGPTVVDHPEVETIAEYLYARDIDVSFSSMRADRLNEVVVRALAKRQRGFTIAPEGGSQKVRNFLGKGLNESHILNAMRLGAQHGLRKLKMYFIYGTPVEGEEDLEEIAKLAREAKKLYSEVCVSLTPLIPKPGTPLEGLKMLDMKELKRRERFLRRRLWEEGTHPKFESLKRSMLQYRISNAREGELLSILEEKMRGENNGGANTQF
ncbi:MAG: radical SAM protein [Thermotogae bacterium]|nr:MAG: radical SAM protein [Thermotogota bacterium]